MSNPTPTNDLLRSLAEMSRAEGRTDSSRALARLIGAEDLIVFVRDPLVGRSLPGPAFPQTLPQGGLWRTLVEQAASEGRSTLTVTAPGGAASEALAIGIDDGTVMAFLGGVPHESDLATLRSLLPIIGALLRMESLALHAGAETVAARQAATESAAIAAKLDTTRADLQRALAVADSASRARDEFLATVSHELRTPLTSMIGWIELLRDEKNAQMFSDGLDTIDRNAHAQARLIEDILDFSRINAGKLRLEVRPLELVDVIASAIEVVRPGAAAKGVQVSSVLDPNAGIVSGDPDRLQQVVWNLLSNAVKFTPKGGKVQVRLERINSFTSLTVSDTGEGIPAEFLPYVFDRFSQADTTSTRIHSGLGLGLGIVRHLVELHGGTVQVSSDGEGKGAAFTVRLPLIVAHPEEFQPERVQKAAPGAPPRKVNRSRSKDLIGVSILVVEDNDDARALLVTILKRSGATVASAENPPAALALMSTSRPDIIISDIEMPREDGYSFIKKVRLQESPTDRIPAIALTAYARGVDRVRALAAGFQMHMGKPVEPAELVAAVKSLLSTRGPRRAAASSSEQ